jgi:hypothetical protein
MLGYMDVRTVLDDQWPYLLSFLPDGVDLEASARETKAFVRARGVRSPDALLRLAFAYGVGGMSLRETAAWAKVSDLADLSDVALLNRLRRASDWLGVLLGRTLASHAEPLPKSATLRRICLVDATTISIPGSEGTDWRIHLRFDLERMSIIDAELTDVHGGETLARHNAVAGDIVIGDRAYGTRRGLDHVTKLGADFLVRLTWHNLPLTCMDGEPFDILAALRKLPGSPSQPRNQGKMSVDEVDPCASTREFATGEFFVKTAPTKEYPAIEGRLIAVRKSKAKADADRDRIRRNNTKKGRKTDPRTLEAANYTFVFTSLPSSEISASDLLALYRFRWQIELAFKRLKSLLDLNVLLARDQALARTALFAKLLASILIDALTVRFVDFSPWGFRFPVSVDLARPQDARQDDHCGDPRE